MVGVAGRHRLARQMYRAMHQQSRGAPTPWSARTREGGATNSGTEPRIDLEGCDHKGIRMKFHETSLVISGLPLGNLGVGQGVYTYRIITGLLRWAPNVDFRVLLP